MNNQFTWTHQCQPLDAGSCWMYQLPLAASLVSSTLRLAPGPLANIVGEPWSCPSDFDSVLPKQFIFFATRDVQKRLPSASKPLSMFFSIVESAAFDMLITSFAFWNLLAGNITPVRYTLMYVDPVPISIVNKYVSRARPIVSPLLKSPFLLVLNSMLLASSRS